MTLIKPGSLPKVMGSRTYFQMVMETPGTVFSWIVGKHVTFLLIVV